MAKLQYECNEYKLYSPDSLRYITDNMHQVLLQKLKEYKELFKIETYRQIQINCFDDINKFRTFIHQISEDELPEYATATYHNGMINAYMPNNLKVNSLGYKDRLTMANHELFHIMYKELVLKNDTSNRIVWYDEGMAQLTSGEKDELLDIEQFKDYYFIVKEQTKEIPKLNKLTHEESFVNELYNGYDLSYLSVRYLKEILSEEEFKELVTNPNKVLQFGESIIQEMFEYYDTNFITKQRK